MSIIRDVISYAFHFLFQIPISPPHLSSPVYHQPLFVAQSPEPFLMCLKQQQMPRFGCTSLGAFSPHKSMCAILYKQSLSYIRCRVCSKDQILRVTIVVSHCKLLLFL